MEKNEIVFTILNNEYIIECECLDNLIYNYYKPVHDENFASYYCNKVKIIAIYNNNKLIIESIIISGYEYSLKKDSIMSLENFKKNIYYKTFLRAYIHINKINNIMYCIKDNGEILSFYNDDIHINHFVDIFNIEKLKYYAIIHCNGKNNYSIYYNNNNFNITDYSYDKLYYYYYKFFNNEIKITKLIKKKEKNIICYQYISCDINLNILQLSEWSMNRLLYKENRNSDGKIINIIEYNHSTNKNVIISSNNSIEPLKSNKNFPQDLLKFYMLNIKFNTNIIFIKEQLNKAQLSLINEQLKYI